MLAHALFHIDTAMTFDFLKMCIRAEFVFAYGNWFQVQWLESKFCCIKSGFWPSGVNNPAVKENLLKSQSA